MADERVYSDEEFALILRKAAELGSRAESPARSAGGLTLAEMKSAARQAGLDPTLVERAARGIAGSAPASRLERLTGGPLTHHHEAHFPIELDGDRAARLLSVVRINASLAGSRDVGHSSSMGMTWHDGSPLESVKVTASLEENGTLVTVALDRSGTFVLTSVFTGMALFLALLFSVFGLYAEAPALGVAGVITSIGGALAAVRGFWAASTREARARIGRVMEAIEKTFRQPEVVVTPGEGETVLLEAGETGS